MLEVLNLPNWRRLQMSMIEQLERQVSIPETLAAFLTEAKRTIAFGTELDDRFWEEVRTWTENQEEVRLAALG